MLIAACSDCGLRCYPAPLVCSRCHATDFDWITTNDVQVLVVTRSPRADYQMATVMGDDGPRMIARVPEGAVAGDRLVLEDSPSATGAFVPPDPRAPVV